MALSALVAAAAASELVSAEDEGAPPKVETLVARVVKERPVIDGVLTPEKTLNGVTVPAEWPDDPASTARIDQADQCLAERRGRWKGPEDASAVVRVAADATALYLGISVTDDVRFHAGEPWWTGDAIELFLNTDPKDDVPLPDGSMPENAYSDDDWQIFLMPSNPNLHWGVAYRGKTARFDDGGLVGVEVASVEKAGGSYDLEARIPLANFPGLAGVEARRIGFAVAIDDVDRMVPGAKPGDAPTYEPGTYLSWNRGFVLWRKPRNFGWLEIPARPATPAAESAIETSGSAVLWVAAAIALLLVVVMVGPASRRLARFGPKPKVALLVLDALLASGVALSASCADGRARSEARERIDVAAREANVVAREAADLGALDARSGPARAKTLVEILSGKAVPCVPPVSDQAFVAFPGGDAADAFSGDGPPVDVAAGADLDWPLLAPVAARALRVRIEPTAEAPDARGPAQGRMRLAILQATAADGATTDLPVEADLSPGGERWVRLPLETPATLVRLRWRAAAFAPPLRLQSLVAQREDGGETALALPSWTEDGVPVMARPGAPAGSPPFRGLTLGPGAGTTVPLPGLAGADRLWVVVTAERAFPLTRHGLPVARLRVLYASGEPESVDLRNGDDVDDERLVNAFQHPDDMRSRIAWRWTDGSGVPRHHDALAVPLDPTRRPVGLEAANEAKAVADGGTGAFTVVAATLTRRATDPKGGRLVVSAGAARGADTVRLADARPFADVLALPAPGVVALAATVGREDRRTTVTFATLLPDAIRGRAERTETALLTAMVLAALLLVLLVVDAAQGLRRLRPRLVVGVLAAALLPVVVTIGLADRSNAARAEEGGEARVKAGLDLVRHALLEGEQPKAQVGAQGLLQVVASLEGRDDPTRLVEAVSVYRRAVKEAQAAVVVKGRDLGTVAVPPETRGARIDGAGFLAERTGPPGLYASPWDGLLLVATARSADADWRKVVVGTRVDDAFANDRLRSALADPDAEVAVLDRTGAPVASAGPGGQALGRALSERFSEVEGGAGGHETVRFPDLPTSEGPRLAILSPLASAESRTVPAGWLAVGLPRRTIEEQVLSLREELLGLGIAAAVLVACVAAVLARRIAGPVRELVAATDAIRHGEFDVAVPRPSRDEVGDLAAAFDRMRRDLKHRMGDLDFLRRSQERATATLDLPSTAEAALACFRERWSADTGLLLLARSPSGPLETLAEWGRRTPASDHGIDPSPAGWALPALKSSGGVLVEDAAADPRARAEAAPLRLLLSERNAFLAVPLKAGGETQGLVVLAWAGAASMPREEERALLLPLSGIVALGLQNARLYRLAALDEGTGLPGATAFESGLRRDVDAALSGGPSASVLRIGLDGIERIARRHGLEPARALLRAQADALRGVLAGRAQAGRWREGEFAVRVPGVPREEALRLAATVKDRLSAVEVRPEAGGEAIRSGVSVGVACCPDDARSTEFLLDAAERALLAARRDGGDRVEDARRLAAGLVDVPPFEDGAVFRTESMVRVLETARRAARTDSTVLVTGETGVGKEVVADLIHRRSTRAERSFVKVNVAAFPESLLESELFGHEKGAFTGAERRREGRFELADGGTLFLDEVGEMPPAAQVRLLRVLADGQLMRLGGSKPIQVDVRVIAATNRDLEAAVALGRFREDLYYRLNVLRIEIPPLRTRREEIPALVEHFLEDSRHRIGRGPLSLSPQAMDVLYRHPWPGNVRELKNVIERAAVLCEGDVAGPQSLRIDPPRGSGIGSAAPSAAPLDGLNERQRALLNHLAAKGRSTNREYIDLTRSSARTGLRDLQDLMAKGLIVREGKRRGAVYRLP